MSTFSEYISSQFGNPRGPIGTICCLIMNNMNRSMYQSIIHSMKLGNQSKVLDIGYGNGYLIQQILKKSPSEVYGIDISEDMRQKTLKRNKKAAATGQLHVSLGNCCDLSYEDNVFDVVTSVNTVYFWEDTEKGFSEVYRVLKKGGIFYNAVYSKEWLQTLSYTKTGFRFFHKKELAALGKQVGFSKVMIKEIVRGKSYVMGYRK